jgi:hypothetical protein
MDLFAKKLSQEKLVRPGVIFCGAVQKLLKFWCFVKKANVSNNQTSVKN